MKNREYIEKQDQQLFNSIAAEYSSKDQYIVSSKAREFQLMSLFRLIESNFNKTHFRHILEIGCGVGANSKYLIHHFDNYTGVDYSEELIKLGEKMYGNRNVTFIQGNLRDITLNNTSFDLVIGIGILHHLPDISIVLRNLKKQLNPDTIYGFIEVQSGNPFINLIRYLRKLTDPHYSKDQNIFSKKFVFKVFRDEGFKITDFLYQGYFTPPFAQLKLKPEYITLPLVKASISADKFIQNNFPNFLSWNIAWLAQYLK